MPRAAPNCRERRLAVAISVCQVAIFQGLTFHQVRKSADCELDTCRRITIRYVDGKVTRWRTDVPQSRWPVITQTRIAGALTTDTGMASVYRGLGKEPDLRSLRDSDRSHAPNVRQWLKFAMYALLNGLSPKDIIFRCPDRVDVN